MNNDGMASVAGDDVPQPIEQVALIPAPGAAITPVHLADLLRSRIEAALQRLAPGSRRQYERTLRLFATWGASSDAACKLLSEPAQAAWWQLLVQLLRAGPLISATLVETYLAEGCRGKAPATVAQRLASIKWTIRLARQAGIVLWDLHVRAPKVRAYRDTRGPGLDGFRAMLAVAQSLPEHQRLRDVVMLGFLFILGLRRGEVASLRVGDLDLDGRRLFVLGKAREYREPVSVPVALAERLRAYLQSRGDLALEAPLFASQDPARKGGGGLTTNGIYRRVRRLADLAGLPHVTPHGLRHGAITAALDALNGDLRRVRAFARHAKPETTIVYDDRRRDVGGEVADELAALAGLTGGPF